MPVPLGREEKEKEKEEKGRMYQDVTSVDSGCGLQLRGSRIVIFGGGTFAFVFRLIVAFGCGFLAGCHGKFIC